MKKTIVSIVLVLTLLFTLSAGTLAAEPSVTASAAIVMDYDSGAILYAKDIDTMRCPASMTKIMTAYIIYQELEKGTITKDTQFTISNHARSISKNSNYPMAVPLVGSTVSVGKLLDLIMVPSASASCIVAAENISGSEAAFVNRMNATAREMGIQTAYQNCHGAIPHYVTCRSVAVLIRNFINDYPDILSYTCQTGITYNGNYYKNTNNLLNSSSSLYYPDADGFKTGTIAAAGYCLAATAERDDRRLITVVMNSSNTTTRHTDSKKLLDYGFSELAKYDQAAKDATVEFIVENPLRIGADVKVSAKFSNVSYPFITSFQLAVDGKACATVTQKVQEGSTIDFMAYLDESYAGKTGVSATLSYGIGAHSYSHTALLPVSDEPMAHFRDTAYLWAEKDIDYLFEQNIVNGYGDRTYRPQNNISRAEFATILYRSFTFAEEGTPISFTDTQNHWAKESIAALSALGIVVGYQNEFRPDDFITREEAVAILNRILKYEGADAPAFSDTSDISQWAFTAVANLTEKQIINGYPDGTFRPLENLSRAETAALLKRILTLPTENN